MGALFDRVWASLRLSRRTTLCLVLAAFVAQSTATLAHLHAAAGSATQATQAADANSGSGKLPGDRGDQLCPICQAASIAGSAVAPSAPVFSVPITAGPLHPLKATTVAMRRLASPWRSRAPPTV